MNFNASNLSSRMSSAASQQARAVRSSLVGPSAYSGESGHSFRSIPATCSGGFRPPIPDESGHRFRGIPATP
ncbi:MAG: hypothetical protein ISR66_22415 [Desulfobacula sp.]|nr:hypothetical protein [Desulfobacula sp.]